MISLSLLPPASITVKFTLALHISTQPLEVPWDGLWWGDEKLKVCQEPPAMGADLGITSAEETV